MWRLLAPAKVRSAYIFTAVAFMNSEAKKCADLHVQNVKKKKKVQ